MVALIGGGLFVGGLGAPHLVASMKGIKVAKVAKSVITTSQIAAGAGGATLAVDAAYTCNRLNTLMKGDNYFKRKKGRITTGLSVKFNGKDKGWYHGHTEIVELARFVPIILKKLHKKFPAHYTSSGIFNLNIETKEDCDHEDSIHITIHEAGSMDSMPESFYYLANDSKNDEDGEKEEAKQELSEECEQNLLRTDDFNRRTFKNESAFSDEEAARFIKKYKRSLNSYGN